ncbi:cyclase family protein [Agrobacterium sp. MCAB5]|uniref:cyclase family protein n=1 Tax=Agrobacterium sp. MCAB5 TaxID=3233042 RepID=UPI003F90525F
MTLPKYHQLPIDPSKPPRSAWGLWGDEDQLGSLNLLGEEQVRRAKDAIKSFETFSLNWHLEMPDPPLFGRHALKHHPFPIEVGFDDSYDNFSTQASTQWDALSHIEHPQYGSYNGRTREQLSVAGGAHNGIHHYARKGIVGRGVLLDVATFLAEQGRPVDCSQRRDFTVAELEATRKWAGIQYEVGDILVVRTGWIGWYEQADRAIRVEMAEGTPKTPGLAGGEDMAEYLWNSHFSAVTSDCPAVEAWPHELEVDKYLHFRLIPLLGFALGEMWDVEALARACALDRRYDFMVTAAPLNKLAGVGSPGNVLAIR